jgi:regulator of protease activity HflC (stomatin/prohibitin superfamily)
MQLLKEMPKMEFFIALAATFVLCQIALPLFLAILRFFGLYTLVYERTAVVYTFLGKVAAVIEEPGFCFLFLKLWWRAPLISFFGERYVVDLRIDQKYLRSQPVNSEEGAPMGVGIWYEKRVSDPVAFLFNNTDPQGSLRANVSNAAVRCLSNMKLERLLENRHEMSEQLRKEVSQKSVAWGYHIGSIYIRKVHFRDLEMIRQIEAKVVNRLRQVTSAIKQDGANQVNVISSSAEKLAAAEFAKAASIRPLVIGQALNEISVDPVVAKALFDILETQKLIESESKITLIPAGQSEMLSSLVASGSLS